MSTQQPAIPDGGESTEALPSVPETETLDDNDDPPFPEDESPFEKTYVAIDGVKPEDFTEAEKERLTVSLIQMMLTDFGKPITDVRVIDEGTNVIEVEVTDGDE